MNDDDNSRKIAGLIGHQQKQAARADALVTLLTKESARLQRENALLARTLEGLGPASRGMASTVRDSVSLAMGEITDELRAAGVAQQQPAVAELASVAEAARASVAVIRRDMAWYTWKWAIGIALTLCLVLTSCAAALTWFMNDGYGNIARMQRMQSEWLRKAPLATFSTCDGKPCVEVTGPVYTNDGGDRFYLIKQ